MGTVQFHEVSRPMGMDVIGETFLDRDGRRIAKDVALHGGRVLVNGGNCLWPDVNWVHYVHAAFEPAVATSLVRKAKGVWHRRRSLSMERDALRSARLVIANSHRTAKDLVAGVGVDPARIRVIYYGIDGASFAPAGEGQGRRAKESFGWSVDRPAVAFIGALGDRRKGFDTLYAAWKTLCAADGWDADLVVIGRGAELPAWQARAKSDGLGERIRFLGFRKDVPKLLDACDALVAPTRYEAFGLGVFEALCKELPAIVSKDAGVAELYPAELSELTNWRSRTGEYRGMMVPFAAKVRSRSWDDMAAEIVRAIDETAA
jgi:glycosyltransferase involved in cell wall biosynthesis